MNVRPNFMVWLFPALNLCFTLPKLTFFHIDIYSNDFRTLSLLRVVVGRAKSLNFAHKTRFSFIICAKQSPFGMSATPTASVTCYRCCRSLIYFSITNIYAALELYIVNGTRSLVHISHLASSKCVALMVNQVRYSMGAISAVTCVKTHWA